MRETALLIPFFRHCIPVWTLRHMSDAQTYKYSIADFICVRVSLVYYRLLLILPSSLHTEMHSFLSPYKFHVTCCSLTEADDRVLLAGLHSCVPTISSKQATVSCKCKAIYLRRALGTKFRPLILGEKSLVYA